jgi:hypothetical protein
MERFSLKKLNDVQNNKKHHTEVSNRFAALQDLDAEVECNSAWETIKASLGYYELRKHKPCFDKARSKLLQTSTSTCSQVPITANHILLHCRQLVNQLVQPVFALHHVSRGRVPIGPSPTIRITTVAQISCSIRIPTVLYFPIFPIRTRSNTSTASTAHIY